MWTKKMKAIVDTEAISGTQEFQVFNWEIKGNFWLNSDVKARLLVFLTNL